MTDKIAEIRERHLHDERWRNGPSMISPQSNDDRAFLLAEVERLNKDLAVQNGCCDGAAAQDAHIRREREEHRAEVERLTRERDEARYFLKIFVHAHASNNAVPPHLEEQARKALEAKP